MMISLSLFALNTVEKIEIFTVDAFPIAHDSSISYCNLDQLKHLEKSIQENAERIISNPNLMTQYNDPLTQAYQCRFQATVYELKLLPAIVMNQSQVAYGNQSIQEALNIYKRDFHA